MTHPTWELPLAEQEGALILTPCPGTKEVDLETSLQQIKQQGAKAVVTALNAEEMQKAGVAELPEMVAKLGMHWYHLPIEDDCAPEADFQQQWNKVSPELHEILKADRKIAIHCMGGSGRTGLLAAHLLLEKQWSLDTIKQQVQALRPGAFTKQVQIDYIDQFAASK
ncbi:cyclin-dependent kinase inhibitor 3 family protein [Vibrio sp. SCSIO 43137]|uniref:cyclin-dependent kinase inhibitor 3 family protein n=1 Tax=Vibrio sp. SCSIO 43137 TaxID=3021011 RepID=UPI0023071B48|nr:cyclin-dependent kinase inhibitor 3 family protein [Vibrio sp. SCSIO 43137]WCE29631.1 cyclin-dependent kinase inhibitor 3 family protein [Vibrio sp. SCSIO 43137]